ncbi:SLC13 family permease [Acidobacteriota bacterium]
MVWLQNLIVVVIGFMLYRLLIEEDLHLLFLDSVFSRAEVCTARLVSTVLLLSYVLSLFFPNTVVVIALIPMIIAIVERVDHTTRRKELTTTLALSLVYGANIGGMGSMVGASSNILFLGFIEVLNVPGRENITFFSWLLFGIPITLMMLFFGKIILTFRIKKLLLKGMPGSRVKIGRKKIRRLLLFFTGNIFFIIILTAAEFFFHPPPPLRKGFNIIDVGLLFYLVLFFVYALIIPKRAAAPESLGGRRPQPIRILPGLRQNLFYFCFFLLLSPLIMVGETWAAVTKRFRLQKSTNPVRDFSQHLFSRFWKFFLGTRPPGIEEKNSRSVISINRLIYDIPYLGLLFMGIVVIVVFIILKLGDNPHTPEIDGWVFQALSKLTGSILKVSDSLWVIIFALIFLTVFSTEVISNATVILVMFSLISTITPLLGVSPLFLMLAITIASTAAFMTPIASPVNAVSYAGLEGVSLKKMLLTGFFMNVACTLWLGTIFYLFYLLFA